MCSAKTRALTIPLILVSGSSLTAYHNSLVTHSNAQLQGRGFSRSLRKKWYSKGT